MTGSAFTSPRIIKLIFLSLILSMNLSKTSFADGFDKLFVSGRHTAEPKVIRFAWPGVYIQANFEGSAIGLTFGENEINYFDIAIDGHHHSVLAQPRGTVWIKDLPEGVHHIQMSKRSESAGFVSGFYGFRFEEGGKLLTPPKAKPRKIIFYGDSFTVGYGLESKKRECSEAEIVQHTNTARSFAAISSRKFNADYQINAVSGRGLVRNYNGGEGAVFTQLYNRTFPVSQTPLWEFQEPAPDAVVIGLGINDFSAPLKKTEKWKNAAELEADYNQAYHALLVSLRKRYGNDVPFILSGTSIGSDHTMLNAVKKVIKQRKVKDDQTLFLWQDPGLELMGCDWHPSAKDHEKLAEGLASVLVKELGWEK